MKILMMAAVGPFLLVAAVLFIVMMKIAVVALALILPLAFVVVLFLYPYGWATTWEAKRKVAECQN